MIGEITATFKGQFDTSRGVEELLEDAGSGDSSKEEKEEGNASNSDDDEAPLSRPKSKRKRKATPKTQS